MALGSQEVGARLTAETWLRIALGAPQNHQTSQNDSTILGTSQKQEKSTELQNNEEKPAGAQHKSAESLNISEAPKEIQTSKHKPPNGYKVTHTMPKVKGVINKPSKPSDK